MVLLAVVKWEDSEAKSTLEPLESNIIWSGNQKMQTVIIMKGEEQCEESRMEWGKLLLEMVIFGAKTKEDTIQLPGKASGKMVLGDPNISFM